MTNTPTADNVAVMASIVASLGRSTAAAPLAITGQMQSKRNLDANLGAYINAEQPLITGLIVNDADIAAQEKRVLDARRRLEETLKHFG